MALRDKLRRYFVANGAPIFSIRWIGFSVIPPFEYVACRTGNSGGFYWLGFNVQWRKPYAKVWCFNPIAKRWEIPLSRPSEKDTIQ